MSRSPYVYCVVFCVFYVYFLFFFFFFQAEDGIRDRDVTGVQTCALPISGAKVAFLPQPWGVPIPDPLRAGQISLIPVAGKRSEERRVGKECRSRWSPYH